MRNNISSSLLLEIQFVPKKFEPKFRSLKNLPVQEIRPTNILLFRDNKI